MPVLTYSLEEKIAVITMDDGKANALSEAMIDELGAAITRAEGEANAIVLVGREGRFCAGFDLKVMMASPEAAQALLRRGANLLMKLYGTPLPLIMACTGHALAGGALVLLTGDVRIGASGAFRIGLNEVSIGMPVPVLAMELARDRLTSTELGRATLEARIYTPDEGKVAGYLDDVVAPTDLVARAKMEAIRLGAYSRFPYQATKKRLRGKTIAHVLGTLDEDMKNMMQGS